MRDAGWPRNRGDSARAVPVTLIRTLAGALACLLIAGLAVVGAPAPTASAQVTPELRVELTRLTPSVVHPDSTIVFEGTVTNVSDRPLVRLQALIWRDLTPITTRSQLEATNASPDTFPVGERMYEQPGWYQDLYTANAPELPPGQSRDFRLEAEAADFFSPTGPQTGVYLAGVQVREDGIRTVGRTRTYLPVQVTAADEPPPSWQSSIETSTLVKLASTPSMVRPDVFADDGLADEVAPGGRLDSLLEAAEETGVSFVVDPNLITELTSMRDGYQVLDSDGKRSEGTGAEDAQAWLSRFEAMRARQDGYRLPYADVDLQSLARAGRLDIARTAERATRQLPELRELPLLVAPPGGMADRRLLRTAEDLGATAVLLADSAVKGLGPVVRPSGGGIKILSYDTEDAAIGPGPDPRDTPVQLRQTALADSYIDAISGLDATTLRRLSYITEADQAASEAASVDAPWVSHSPVSELLGDRGQRLVGELDYPSEAAETELSGKQINRIKTLEHNLSLYRHLLADPPDRPLADFALPRAASSAWRQRPKAMRAFVNDQQRLLTTTGGRTLPLSALHGNEAIRVESNPQVTLTGSSAAIPVTVVNNLNTEVRVKLLATSQNPSRLEVEELPAEELGSVQPGARVPAQIAAHARANGTIAISVQLATSAGEPIGDPLPVQVYATQAGRIGWIIAFASGVVLLLTVVLRIRQVARERGTEPAPQHAAADPDGGAEDG